MSLLIPAFGLCRPLVAHRGSSSAIYLGKTRICTRPSRTATGLSMSVPERISPTEAQSRMARGCRHVDVRTSGEWQGGHVPGTVNVPFMLKGPMGMESNPDFLATMQDKFTKSDPLIVSCLSGKRSDKAADALVLAGFEKLSVLEGGFQAWEKDQSLPVEQS